MDWFKNQKLGHQYWLVSPGPKHNLEKVHDSVSLMQVYGFAATEDPAGYRIIVDYWRIFRLIQRIKPDVIEAGDPWLTGIFCLLLKKSGYYKGRLVSFYHSDPVPSYLEPWAKKGRGQFLKNIGVNIFSKIFYALQIKYDLTSIASKTMETSLRAKNILATAYLPFGVPTPFLITNKSGGDAIENQIVELAHSHKTLKFLYAGRLDKEKGIELLLDLIPKLLLHEKVEITVMGRGAFGERFSAIKHSRLHFLGFVNDVEKVLEVYDSHDILLAPGPYETFGLGVLEAMARGLIVVGPDCGGTAEMLEQISSPYIFKSHDFSDFEKVVFKLIEDFGKADFDKMVEAKIFSIQERSKKMAHEYGSWNDAMGRMIARYSQGIAIESVKRVP